MLEKQNRGKKKTECFEGICEVNEVVLVETHYKPRQVMGSEIWEHASCLYVKQRRRIHLIGRNRRTTYIHPVKS